MFNHRPLPFLRPLATAVLAVQCLLAAVAAPDGAAGLIINEIMPANIDMFVDPSYNYGGFVEIYNPTAKAVTLAGLYISDDAEDLGKHRLVAATPSVPAHGFATLWFDHCDRYCPTQVSYKLDCDGGTIYLSDADGRVVAEQDYPAAFSRASYARTTDGGDEWSWTSTPTPGATNAGSVFASEQLAAPRVSLSSRVFTTSVTFSVTCPVGCTLRYTTDGSTPTLTNGITATSMRMSTTRTTTYRFRLFADGMLPSPVVTRSYLQTSRQMTLPMLSVVTDNKHVYGSELGLFTVGPHGRPGNGRDDKCNWNMDWDRPVNMELIDTDGTVLLNQEADMAACGGWSRAYSPHSFKLKAEKQYEGQNFFPYSVFPTKPYNKNKTLQVRNGGNDNGCRIKDAALQEIVSRSGLNVDAQATVPVQHFLNGQYIGVLNIREPNNKHFVYANYGYDSDEIDQFEISPDSNYIQMTGTKEAFYRWYKLAEKAEDDDTYDEIARMVDIDEFCNYMAVELYTGNWDWPKNNLKGYRPRTDDGRFRFVLFDLDGFNSVGNDPFGTMESKRIFTFDALRGEDAGVQLTEEIEIVTIWLNMLRNARFRKQFADSYCLVAGSVFEPSRCKEIVTEMARRVEVALNQEGASPWGSANDLINTLTSSFQNSRISALRNYSRMKLTDATPMTVVLSSDLEGAQLLMNNLPVPTGRFRGTLFAPVTVHTAAPAGYVFRGWKTGTESRTLFAKGTSWKYYDQGSLDAQPWKLASYGDGSWKTGFAPLGYFTSDTSNGRGYRTTLNYGNNANDKRPTYYFRRQLTLDDAPSASDIFTLDYTCDDGFVIYVNGNEAGRYLMPNGTPSYSTYASSYAPANPESGTLTLSPKLFQKGTNIIAVEVHNNNGTSTDIYWDCALTASMRSTSGAIVSTDPTYTLPAGTTHDLTALFEPIGGTDDGIDRLCVNEVSASNDIYVSDLFKKSDWVELYNPTGHDIDAAGWWLSADVLMPRQWQVTPIVNGRGNVTDATVVPAHGYRVVWCDKADEAVAEPHASFKLPAEGGMVLVTSPDGTWADTLSYCTHDARATVGRYPDGAADVYVLARPTIGAANTLTTVDTPHVQLLPEPDAIRTPLSADATVVAVRRYDLQGRALPATPVVGLYIEQTLYSDGTTVSRKCGHMP